MKAIILLFLLFIISSCDRAPRALSGNYIEQEVFKDSQPNELCGGCMLEIRTYIWHKDVIYRSWYDDFDKMDSISILKRYNEADSILKKIIKYDK